MDTRGIGYSFQNAPNVRSTPSQISYSRKLWREKTFTNFMVLWLFVKVFSMKFEGVVSFGMAKVSNL